MKRLVLYCLASLALALPALAFGQDAYVTGNVNMRAGPDISYPLVDQIPAGSGISVQGCTQGWEWCDVISANNRGWVAGNFIEYNYQNQPVLLPSYGAQVGIPIVTFVIASYWDSYYRTRPFYAQRTVWYRRPYVRRPPPRPMPHPVRPGRPGYGRPPGGGHRPPGNGYRPNPGNGNRPNPGNGNRPNPGNGNRPNPGNGNRPNPGGGNRPNPGNGHRPNPGGGNRPNPGTRPTPGVRPSPGGGRPGNTQRPPMQRPAVTPRPTPATRPAPAARPAPNRGGGAPRPKGGDKKDDRGH